MIKTNKYTQTPHSFIMDETLEVIPKGKEEVKLDILKPHRDGDDIMLKDDVSLAAPVSEQEIAVMEAIALDINDLQERIITQGMSQNIALEMMRYCPDIINDERPKNYFTQTPSKTGVSAALEAIDEQNKSLSHKIKSMIDKIIAWFSDKIKAFKQLVNSAKDYVSDAIGFNRINNKDANNNLSIYDKLVDYASKIIKDNRIRDGLKKLDVNKYFNELIENEYLVSNRSLIPSIYHSQIINANISKLFILFKEVNSDELRDNAQEYTVNLNNIRELINNTKELQADVSFANNNQPVSLFENLYKIAVTDNAACMGYAKYEFDVVIASVKKYGAENAQQLNLVNDCVGLAAELINIRTRHIQAFIHIFKFFEVFIKHDSRAALNRICKMAINT